MIRRPPRSTQSRSSAASDVYKRQHHTRLLDGPGLDQRLRRFLAGDLGSDEVRDDGGHGAVLSAAATTVDLAALPFFVTGPRRALLAGSALPLEYAVPYGDLMLTGCFGLLRAFAERGVTPGGES